MATILCCILLLISSISVFAESPSSTSSTTVVTTQDNAEINDSSILFTKTVTTVNTPLNESIQPLATTNWRVIVYTDGTLSVVNLTTNLAYNSHYSTNYVGYGYATSGSQVYGIQGILNVLGYNVSIDGLFGPQTYNAIVSFQTNYKSQLTVDGIAGPSTFNWGVFLLGPVSPAITTK